MADDSTLLAYLIPKISNQVENAATDALGYILNGSEASRDALNCLLREGGFDMPPIVEVATQVTLEDGLRPDMAGYDEKGVNRLLVESKFWAPLLSGQASGYLRQLDAPGHSALLFIAPSARLPTLWKEIGRQIAEESEGTELSEIPESNERWSATVVGAQKRVILVSWDRLLGDMERATSGNKDGVSDISQLRGLTRQQDGEAFLPIRAEELNPSIARRALGYVRLVNDLVDSRGVPQGWMSTEGLRVTPRWHGYGRYIWFVGADECFWLGINNYRWARSEDTPLWLRFSHDKDGWVMPHTRKNWFPLYLKLGVEYPEVLDDVASQLKAIAKDFGANPPGE